MLSFKVLLVCAFAVAIASAKESLADEVSLKNGGEIPIALGGIDAVACSVKKSSKTACSDLGSQDYSTQYTSVDAEGNGKYTSEFR